MQTLNINYNIDVSEISKILSIDPSNLIRESILSYLRQQLIKINSEMILLMRKYDVTNIQELNEKVIAGKYSESDIREDYYKLDNYEYRRDELTKIISNA